MPGLKGVAGYEERKVTGSQNMQNLEGHCKYFGFFDEMRSQ